MLRYLTLNKLRNGETIELEGCLLKQAQGRIEPGDFYIAERNTGPKLLILKEEKDCFFVPEGSDYRYDTNECVKVVEVRS